MVKNLLTVTEAAEYVGVSAQTLRRWHNKGSFRASFVGPGCRRLYTPADLELLSKGLVQIAKEWVSATTPYQPSPDFYCQTSDVLKARVERLARELEASTGLRTIGSLVSSVAGEIGNNAFDHNIGNWPDVPGAFFAYDCGKRLLVIADRGRGVLATLRQVRPAIRNDSEAIHIAFTEVLTGRAPEHRGNGLKYVRKAVDSSGFKLSFASGNAVLTLLSGQAGLNIQTSIMPIAGCLVVLKF